MEYGEIRAGVTSLRNGTRAPLGEQEAAPLTGPRGETSSIALRRGDHIEALLRSPWSQTLALAYSSDGARIAAAGYPGGVCVWDSQTGILLGSLGGPRPWQLTNGPWCLPVRFAANDQILLVGGRELVAVEASGWTPTTLAEFPVVAILCGERPEEALLVGPDEDDFFPVEALDLDSFSLSARAPVLRAQRSTTELSLGPMR